MKCLNIKLIIPACALLYMFLFSCGSVDIPHNQTGRARYPLKRYLENKYEITEYKRIRLRTGKLANDSSFSFSCEISRLENQRKQIIYISAFSLGFIALLLIYTVYIRLRLKKRTGKIIAEKNEDIMQSLNYAKGIQHAILPGNEKIKEKFDNFFLIFRPKDLVSGDFYWIKSVGNKIFVVIADCTGHGIPGAIISAVGSTLLDQIILEKQLHEPAEILFTLNINIRTALKQEKHDSSANDGMDVALCVYEPDKKKITFAGANRPIFVKNHNKEIEIKGDRKSIGGKQKEPVREYKAHELELNAGDMVYMFTDGYTDQNNSAREKIGMKNLKKIINEAYHYNINVQEQKLLDFLLNHQGETEQRDDITLFGFRVN